MKKKSTIALQCHRCGYAWEYRGVRAHAVDAQGKPIVGRDGTPFARYTGCPNCRTSVKIVSANSST
jgi:hypothetical protein